MTPSPEPVVSGLPDTKRRKRKTVCPHCGQPPAQPKQPRASTSDEDYRASMIRLANNYARRIESAGPSALADAVAVRAALDLVIDAGVEVCRSAAWAASWAEIAAATGLSRSAAAERWARFEAARTVGGQPSNLR
jgi:hypothetical protein